MLLAWAAAATSIALLSAGNMRAGRQAADEARSQGLRLLRQDQGRASMERARQHFGRAKAGFSSPLLAPFRAVPVLERQLRAASDLAVAAQTLADVGVGALTDARALLATKPPAGPARAALVRKLAALAERTERRLAEVELAASPDAFEFLRDARTDLGQAVGETREDLRDGAALAGALGDLLQGPRSYLVFAANTAEMRAGSGMFLSVGRLDSHAGRLSLSDLQSVTEVTIPAGVSLDGDLAARWGWLNPQADFRNLMLSPRFEEAAQLAARMWAAAGHGEVDGVLAVDPAVLRALLFATGPVSAGGRSVTAANVVKELTHDQYVTYAARPSQFRRREQLGEIASAAFQAFEAGDWSPERLVSGLSSAAKGRHLMLWSRLPHEQRGWRAGGIDGRIRSESLLPAIVNRGGNKLDYWLRIRTELELRAVGDHTEGVVRLHLRNAAPLGEPPYIAGPPPGLPIAEAEYLGLVSVTLPGRSQNGRFDGVASLAVAGRDGPTRVIAAEFRLPRGASRTIVARFRLPGRHGRLRVEPSGRLPGGQWTFREQKWPDNSAHSVRW